MDAAFQFTQVGNNASVNATVAGRVVTRNLTIPSQTWLNNAVRNVTEIAANGFSVALCNEVVIPSSVFSIGSNAFNGCVNLSTVYIERTVPGG